MGTPRLGPGYGTSTIHKRGNSQYKYGTRDHSDVDSYLSDDEDLNSVKRQVAEFRSKAKRLEVQMHSQKVDYDKEVKSLAAQLNAEKKRRLQVYKDKIDRINVLMHEAALKE